MEAGAGPGPEPGKPERDFRERIDANAIRSNANSSANDRAISAEFRRFSLCTLPLSSLVNMTLM